MGDLISDVSCCASAAKLLYASYNVNDVNEPSFIILLLLAVNYTPKSYFVEKLSSFSLFIFYDDFIIFSFKTHQLMTPEIRSCIEYQLTIFLCFVHPQIWWKMVWSQ